MGALRGTAAQARHAHTSGAVDGARLARCSIVESRAERRLTAENARLREALARSVAVVQRANGLASLGLLTAGLAHEIRSPLVALRVFAQLLPDRWEDTEFRSEFSSVAVAEVDRVDALVRELLRLAHDAPPREGGAGAPASEAAPRMPFAETIGGLMPLLRVQARRKDLELVFAPRRAPAAPRRAHATRPERHRGDTSRRADRGGVRAP